jgi:hypothetical protein
MYQGQVQLAAMTQSLFNHAGVILRMSGEPFATLSGKVARICELDEVGWAVGRQRCLSIRSSLVGVVSDSTGGVGRSCRRSRMS